MRWPPGVGEPGWGAVWCGQQRAGRDGERECRGGQQGHGEGRHPADGAGGAGPAQQAADALPRGCPGSAEGRGWDRRRRQDKQGTRERQPVLPCGGIVGGHFDQAADLVGRDGQEPDAGEGVGQYPSQHDHQVVAGRQVRPLVGQDGLEFRSVQAVQRSGGDHHAVPAGQAVHQGAVVVEDHQARDRAGPPDEGQGLVVPGPAAPSRRHRRRGSPEQAADRGQRRRGRGAADGDPARGGIVVGQLGRDIQIHPVRQAGNRDEQASQQHGCDEGHSKHLTRCDAEPGQAPGPRSARQPPGSSRGYHERVRGQQTGHHHRHCGDPPSAAASSAARNWATSAGSRSSTRRISVAAGSRAAASASPSRPATYSSRERTVT